MALAVLGLDRNCSIADVRLARRGLARSLHPDVGGRNDDMVRLNRAVDVVIAHLRSSAVPEAPTSREPEGWMVDRPSFTVDVLPVEAFEWLVFAARILGDLVDEEPPYALEVLIDGRPENWCRLEVVPDAGSSTVSIIADMSDPTDLVTLWVMTINEVASGDETGR